MRILIIGNDPHDIGGVANYTRPLALKYAELGHRVFYFYSGAWNKRYNWKLKPYLKIRNNDYPFECAEVINSPNWFSNYGSPRSDIYSPATEKIFEKYLDTIIPDVIHCNSLLGLPASLLRIASEKEIKVYATVHTYGFICQKRVMIDHEGIQCNGPSDLAKCVICTGKLNIKKLKLAARIKNTSRILLSVMLVMKRALQIKRNIKLKNLDICDSLSYEGNIQEMQARFDFMIDLLNKHVNNIICVSSDVRNILQRYGVSENKMIVQSIGSVIAEKQKENIKRTHHPLVIGNIGGVNYYKGTHVLIDAISKLSRNDFVVKIFGKYEDEYVKDIMKFRHNMPVSFYGKYKYEDLPAILDQIDVMVLPSICNDTAPQTIFESYSGRVPIIASNIGGFPDFVENGRNGLLFKPSDSGDLADKICKILDNPGMLEHYSRSIPRLKTIHENAYELLKLFNSGVIQ